MEVEDDVPRAHLPTSFSFADFAHTLAGGFDSESKEEQTVWQLAQILFDSQDPTQDSELARKQMLVPFWKSVVTAAAVEHAESAATAEEKAIAWLSGYNVWNASEVLSKDNPRLDVIISQIDGGDPNFQQAMKKQVEHWVKQNEFCEMPARIRALYELAAGNTCVSQGKPGTGPENQTETFNIATKFNLDWRRAFGLRLWYGIDANADLSTAIDLYDEDLTAGKELVKPVPPFSSSQEFDKRQDILFGLLKLYRGANAEESVEILGAENTSGNLLNTRMSFQLLQTLTARHLITVDDATLALADSLTETLVAQLSADGLSSSVQDAIFVALHYTSAGQRATAVQDILSRFAGSIDTDDMSDPSEFNYLTRVLRIPAPWIFRAKAQYVLTVQSDAMQQAHLLLRADDAPAAHDVLLATLGPRLVIAENLPGLKRALAPFLNSKAATSLSVWSAGGALFASFAELIEKVGGFASLRPGARPVFVPGALADAAGLSRTVANLAAPLARGDAAPTLEARAAAVEMARVAERVDAEASTMRGSGLFAAGAGPEADDNDEDVVMVESDGTADPSGLVGAAKADRTLAHTIGMAQRYYAAMLETPA